MTRPGHPWQALAAMTGVQACATVAQSSAAILAPAVAPLLGVAPERVGLYTAMLYLAAMLSGLRSGQWVARLGAMRVSQLALTCCACAALLAASGRAALLLPCAALVGIGYGIVNPASAVLLAHHAPDRARGTFFSIKQAGVPMGVAVAGLLLPVGLAGIGWRASLAVVAVACIALALALWPVSRALEPPPQAATGVVPLMRWVWQTSAIRRLSLASLAFAMTQQCFLTFLVAALTLRLGWSLAAAAGMLALSQGVSVAARITLGAVGDRWVRPERLLAALGLTMGLACLGLSQVVPGAPTWVVVLATLLCAGSAMGWNGVFFADLAMRVPRETVARVSGATQFFTFGGGMLGPLLFGEFIRAGGSYSQAYAWLAVVPAAAGVSLWLAALQPAEPAGA